MVSIITWPKRCFYRIKICKVFAEEETADRIKIRFGVFVNAQQEPEMDERFERARIAADRVKNDPEKICGFYDLT